MKRAERERERNETFDFRLDEYNQNLHTIKDKTKERKN